MACYSKEELERFRDGKMSLLGRLNCSAHLKKCDDCTQKLNELKKDDLLLDELRESLQLFQKLSQTPTATEK